MIEKVTMNLKGKRIEFTLEELKLLKKDINKLLGKREKEIVYIPFERYIKPDYPYWFTTTGDVSMNGSITVTNNNDMEDSFISSISTGEANLNSVGYSYSV